MQREQEAADQAVVLTGTEASQLPETGDAAEIRELRAQVAEYQRIFDKAAPRLAAFRQLEEIARERKTDPASVAAEAALEVLKRDQIELTKQRDDLEKEVAMLLGRKQDEIEIIDEITIESNDIHQEVGEILDELLLLKEDAVRLMSEKTDLELNIQALKLELALLQEKKVKAKKEVAGLPAAPDATENPDRSGEPAVSRGSRTEDLQPGKACDFDAEAENEDEEGRLFDEFFHAQVEHDKARDWMLG